MSESSQFVELVGQHRRVSSRDLIAGAVKTRNIQDLAVTSAKIVSLEADKITTGTLTAVASLGGGSGTGFVKIDGENRRITVNDGTNDRILIGYQSGGF